MKIKTVLRYCKNISDAEPFDEEVNKLLAEGWGLARREIFSEKEVDTFYAELVKLDEGDLEDQEAEPITLQEAVAVLRETCQCADDCSEDGCLMFAWCQKNLPAEPPPANWDDPAKLEQPE